MTAIISEVKGLVKNDFNKEKKKPQDTILWLSKHCLFIYNLYVIIISLSRIQLESECCAFSQRLKRIRKWLNSLSLSYYYY